jgi:hypothetical protein
MASEDLPNALVSLGDWSGLAHRVARATDSFCSVACGRQQLRPHGDWRGATRRIGCMLAGGRIDADRNQVFGGRSANSGNVAAVRQFSALVPDAERSQDLHCQIGHQLSRGMEAAALWQRVEQ